jgi:hypothetical protein
MALSVKTPADTTLLCSVADVMDELGCAVEDKPTLSNIIQQVSDAVVAYCGRYFAKQTYEETVAGYGDVHLVLSVWPVISVTTVLANGTAVTDYTLQEPESGMLYRAAGWSWTTQTVGKLLPDPWPFSEEQIFSVEYVAGYDLPDALLPTLPGDVERAAIIIAKDWFANRKRNVSIKRMSTPDFSADYLAELFPAAALRLLSTYRVVV